MIETYRPFLNKMKLLLEMLDIAELCPDTAKTRPKQDWAELIWQRGDCRAIFEINKEKQELRWGTPDKQYPSIEVSSFARLLDGLHRFMDGKA